MLLSDPICWFHPNEEKCCSKQCILRYHKIYDRAHYEMIDVSILPFSMYRYIAQPCFQGVKWIITFCKQQCRYSCMIFRQFMDMAIKGYFVSVCAQITVEKFLWFIGQWQWSNHNAVLWPDECARNVHTVSCASASFFVLQNDHVLCGFRFALCSWVLACYLCSLVFHRES